MTQAPQPTRGSLSAKVIRACRVHADCSLECPQRRVLDLGEIANFDRRVSIRRHIIDSYLKWVRDQRPEGH